MTYSALALSLSFKRNWYSRSQRTANAIVWLETSTKTIRFPGTPTSLAAPTDIKALKTDHYLQAWNWWIGTSFKPYLCIYWTICCSCSKGGNQISTKAKGVGLQLYLGVEYLGNNSGKAEREFGYLKQRSTRIGSIRFCGNGISPISMKEGN